MTKYIGIYVGNVILEHDLKYQEWLRKGRLVLFMPHVGSGRKTMRRLGRI